MFWIWLARTWPRWRQALVIVQPQTVLAWHRAGYRAYWRWRSRGKPGRPRIPLAHIRFIHRISFDHPEWGEDRIALELKLKLGVEHSTSTIRRYMVDTPRPPSDRWRTFLARHRAETWAIDFATVPLWNFQLRTLFVVLDLHTRQVVHVGVTAHPTLDWVKRRLKEAMPYGEGPRFLIHDNDGIFGRLGSGPFRSALDAWLQSAMDVRGVPIPYGAPNANAFVERFIGTLRRECLNHFLFRSDAHLRAVVREYVAYYNEARPHQGIEGIPAGLPEGLPPAVGPPDASSDGRLVARPILHGLHHDYQRAA